MKYRVWGILAAFAASISNFSSAAQTVEDALDTAGDNLAAAIGRHREDDRSHIGIARFLGSAGTTCEPMSSILTDRLRQAVIHHAERMGIPVAISEQIDPGKVQAVISAQWHRDVEGKVRLTFKIGDVTSMLFENLAMDEVRFDETYLPPDARRCLLDLEPVEREIVATRQLLALDAPYSMGKPVTRIASGERVWVSARVLSKGAEGWFVVRLSDDETMPVGMRERRAFVFDVPLPADFERRYSVKDMDTVMFAPSGATIRAEPHGRADELAKLAAGELIQATGQVVSRDWVRINWIDTDAFVYSPSLIAVSRAEANTWEKVGACVDRRSIEAFLDSWPNGVIAPIARKCLAALGSAPLSVQVWAEQETYRAGETMKLFIKGNKDFYARIIYRDVAGNLIQLLPNAYRKSNRFLGGETFTIPDSTDRFSLDVGAPFGAETLFVLASTEETGSFRGTEIGGGLSLLTEDIDTVRGQTRSIALRPLPEGGKPEYVEVSAQITTRP